MDFITIKIAGQDYKIQSLTIQQLEDLHVGLFDAEEPKQGARGEAKTVWDRNVEIISVALSEDHPEMTPEKVRKMRFGTLQNAKDIVAKILKFSGLVTVEETPSGEEGAVAR